MEIKVPELGESVTEGTVSKWAVHVGDRVNQGDIIAEIETDKVNLELIAEENGTIREILKQEGDTVRIGEVIAVLGEGGAAAAGAGAGGAAEAAGGAGAMPAADAGAAAVVPAAAGAGAAAGAAGAQAAVPTGGAGGTSEQAAPAAGAARSAAAGLDAAQPNDGRGLADIPASPAARRFAREHGVDLRQLATADPLGRINAFDAKAYAGQTVPYGAPAATATPTGAPAKAAAPAAPQPAGAAPAPSPAAQAVSADKPVETIRMSRRRQTIANRLVEVQHTAAMLTTFNEIDMSYVNEVRNRRKTAFFEKHSVKLGYMSFFTKAVVGALKQFPLLNAEIRGTDILVKKYYDIGIAVSTEEGLVVPVVRGADRLSFAEIEKEIADLADKARHNRLKIADLQGGTFTITNGGVFGSLLSTPILNPPQVGILGMHTIQTRPVAIDGQRMENRPMMYTAVSYDHRIVDGKEAVGFLVQVKKLLEDPESLMFDV